MRKHLYGCAIKSPRAEDAVDLSISATPKLDAAFIYMQALPLRVESDL
jgi:hypothetical protein